MQLVVLLELNACTFSIPSPPSYLKLRKMISLC